MILRVVLTILLTCASVHAQSSFSTEKYRFTVITPNLIRIEYSPAGRFVDEPTMFAIERGSRVDAAINTSGDETTIDTGVITMIFKDDGNRPSRDNLRAVVRHGKNQYEWNATRRNTQNLGGTIQTLDGVSHPVDLGFGLIARDGWSIVDDSGKHVLVDGWITPRTKDDGAIDWYFFGYGTDYRAAFRSFAAVSGKVPMPRKYALGAWYSRWWDYTSDDYRAIVREYDQHQFPLDVMVLDMEWHITDIPPEQGGGWTGFSWNRKLLPDAEELLKWFHQQQLAVTLNLHPAKGIRRHETAFVPMMRELGLDPDRDPPPPFDIGNRAYVQAYFKHAHNPLEDAGVDFWWMDWQQDGEMPFIPSVPGMRHLPWLNHLYYRQTERAGLRGQSFSRWGGWGDHRYPIHFSGDATTNWEMLAFQVPFTATAGNVGCFFWSHDIGGHYGERIEESYARWCQFGALTAALRSHSTRDPNMDRRPWKYETWATDSMRKSFHLRSRLFPYIYSSVAQSCLETIPLNRPMYLEHPDSDESYRNPQQFYFGDHLLAAPITMPGIGERRIAWQIVSIPPGEWVDFFSGVRYVGPDTRIIACTIDEFPLLVRAGAPIAMQPYRSRMTQAPLSDLVIRVHPSTTEAAVSAMLHEDDGVSPAFTDANAARTEISATSDRHSATISIGATSGTFKSQPKTRNIVIELPFTAAATRVVTTPVDHDLSYKDRTNRIELRDVPIESGVTVIVDFQPLDPIELDREARKKLLDSLDSHEPSHAPALLAIEGVALLNRIEHPTGFSPATQLVLIAPSDSAVSPTATLTLNGNATTVELTPGKAINTQPLIDSLSPEASIWRQSGEYSLQFEIDGKSQTLSAPATPWKHASTNLAATARVEASSSEPGYSPRGAIDNRLAGYPGMRSAEWASNGQSKGASIRLSWNEDVQISRIILCDRTNLTDHVKRGTLRFSDGSTIAVEGLSNDGTPLTISFEPRTTRFVQFVVEECSDDTKNAGLAEFAVFR